jgi:putative transposase
MAKLYSLDLRERVAAFALAKGSTSLAAETFSVSKATAVRWAKQLRDTGNVAIGDVGGHRPAILRSERSWLAARIAAEPHVSLRKLLSDLQVRGIAVSYGALWNFVHNEGLSFKKNSSRRRAAKA